MSRTEHSVLGARYHPPFQASAEGLGRSWVLQKRGDNYTVNDFNRLALLTSR